MKKKGRKAAGAVTSPLIRRPIQRQFAIFLLPTLLCFCIGFLWPFIQGIYLSFCRNGQTKPMAKAATTGPINSHAQRRIGRRRVEPEKGLFFLSKTDHLLAV